MSHVKNVPYPAGTTNQEQEAEDRGHASPCTVKIPPPPWRSLQPPASATASWKRLCKPFEDPFLTAMKKCTKDSGLRIVEGRRRYGIMNLLKRGKVTFSCKHECDIREDGLVRLSQLPPLPRERLSSRDMKIS